ncbi:MAG: comEB [Acidobacteriaceae bacterium]|nr:comEB [Acidobacteriaceae bacterium]
MSIAKSVPPVSEASTPETQGRITIPDHVDRWDEYFLNMAKVVSIKSKDPKCPVGAVIVSDDNIVLSTGFNGLARGVHDDEEILLNADEKLKVICHAEHNAIMNASRIGIALQGAAIFVTKFPCLACCNSIIQAGITQIYTHDNEFWNDDPFDKDHSRKKRVLHEAHVKVDAPYHPEFKPTEQIVVRKKRVPGRETNVPARGAKLEGDSGA